MKLEASMALKPGKGGVVQGPVLGHLAVHVDDLQPVLHQVVADLVEALTDVRDDPGVVEVLHGRGVAEHEPGVAVLGNVVAEPPPGDGRRVAPAGVAGSVVVESHVRAPQGAPVKSAHPGHPGQIVQAFENRPGVLHRLLIFCGRVAEGLGGQVHSAPQDGVLGLVPVLDALQIFGEVDVPVQAVSGQVPRP
jgi:hypothetical protein